MLRNSWLADLDEPAGAAAVVTVTVAELRLPLPRQLAAAAATARPTLASNAASRARELRHTFR
ncbi:MAG TPA: hypothetical protein VFJ75_01180 [Gaiellaceae bacterium]|nr:hypothetical protein [Gaiellaceae bacterium]